MSYIVTDAFIQNKILKPSIMHLSNQELDMVLQWMYKLKWLK